MNVLQTERLVLRWLNPGDAAFIFELVNDPSWLKYIGDKRVRTLLDAEDYIRNGPVDMYRRFGFGLYLVESREGAEPLGMCGLIKRESLEDVDLGFAFLPAFRGKGYAYEAAVATMAYGKKVFGLPRIVAIVSRDNLPSRKLLDRLGFRYERTVALKPNDEEVEFYATPA